MKLGLALAGGGMQGIAHIGVIKALRELNINVDYISGTSSGSVYALMYALDYNTQEMIDLSEKYYKILTNIEKKNIFKTIGTYIWHKEIKVEGLNAGEKIENIINIISNKKDIYNIKDVNTPIAITTVDTISSKECIFLSNKCNSIDEDVEYIYDAPIGKAVRASMSFPGLFTTCNFEKYNFIDGGAKDNLPVKILKNIGADKVISISFESNHYVPTQNMMYTVLRALDIFSQRDVKEAQKIADIAIEVDTRGASLLEIDDIEKCIKNGYDSIMKNKNRILEMIEK